MDTITQAHGLTNSPSTSSTEVLFAGKTYKLVHLPYDDYVEFMALIEPVIGTIINVASTGGFNDVGSSLSVLKPFLKTLPDLAWLALKQTDSSITTAFIKANTTSPMQLIEVILAQVKHNEMIKDFTDFFVQISQIMGETQEN